jgi:hypothetical protein
MTHDRHGTHDPSSTGAMDAAIRCAPAGRPILTALLRPKRRVQG